MFLTDAEFLKDFRCFKKGEKLNFNEQITVITGDNGSGKSSLITCIRKNFTSKTSMSDSESAKDVLITNVKDSKDKKIAYLCMSSDLLKNSSYFDNDISFHIKLMGLSSGQGSLEQLVDLVETNKDKPLMIIDEPERGLSLKRILLARNYIRRHATENPNQQIILVTHSPEFMELSDNIYSTSHKKYMTKKEYMDWIMTHNSMDSFA